jgi:hypothetical protein
MSYIDAIMQAGVQSIIEARLEGIFNKSFSLEVKKDVELYITVEEGNLTLGTLKISQVKSCCTFLILDSYEIKNKKLLLFKVAEYLGLHFGYTCLLVVYNGDSKLESILRRRNYAQLTPFLYIKEINEDDIRPEQN